MPYVGAPYNFVPFYNDVVEVEKEKMAVHNVVDDELITGEISYELEAKTPIIVGDGNEEKQEFFRNERGEIAIPGSSMRGLIRNNVQILGLSGVEQDVDDYSIMYRDVANSKNKTYKGILDADTIQIAPKVKISVLKNVQAGYIVKKEGKYYIYQTKVKSISQKLGKMNYYVVSERKIADNKKAYPFFDKHPEYLQNQLEKGFKKKPRGGRVHYEGVLNEGYKPGYYKVSYEIHDLKNVCAIDEPDKLKNNGVLIGTGQIQEKKAQYIIPEIDKNIKPIQISDEDIKSFKIDFEKKKTTVKGKEEFFNLPEKEGEEKPVFYIQHRKKLYFGFTPNLRIFYDYSVKKGLHQKSLDFDYAKSLFGVSNEKHSYKSKVSFTDVVAKKSAKCEKECSLMLLGPKPSSYFDYICQENNYVTTYNTENFELRGIKQYWLRKDAIQGADQIDDSSFVPLDKGTEFTGKIRFQNLTKAELGLLLWSIKLNKNSWMNIGKAKAYGYGAVALSEITLKTVDNSKAYSLDGKLDTNPFVEQSVDEFILAYKKEINEKIPTHDIDKLPHIKDFFMMKDSGNMPEEKKIRYMHIGDKSKGVSNEYQERKSKSISLQTVEEVVNGKPEKNKDSAGVASKKEVYIKKEIQDGSYKAEVKGYQGKKIKFVAGDAYPVISIDDIKCVSDLTKKNMKEKFPEGSKWKLSKDENVWSVDGSC